MGVVETMSHPDSTKAAEISVHDFPNDWPASIGSEKAVGGHGINVTRFAASAATERHEESVPHINSNPSVDFQAFLP